MLGTVLAVAALATAVIHGTDVFCALVLRPAAARASDASVADLVGHIHHFADNRLPLVGVVAVLASLVGTVGVVLTSAPIAAQAAAGVTLAAILGWLAIYLTVSAPLNRRLREAASTHTVPPETRSWQRRWDAFIWPRVALQTIALVGLLFAVLQVNAS